MSRDFPLFSSHIDLAHRYWSSLVKPGDIVVDATCGNGHDSLCLAKLALTPSSGNLIAIDIQEEAIHSSKHLLKEALSENLVKRIRYYQRCHSTLPEELIPGSVKLVVYNLGYLPGGDKSQTTVCEKTLKSLSEALNLIQTGGAVSVTCYPGHAEGEIEQEAILKLANDLDPKIWSCCFHRWLNRKKSPGLLLIQKNRPLMS